MTKNRDEKFIAYALNLAKKNLGKTAPNPVVGCVIVKDDVIISSGVTAINGRPHAEKIAIDNVKDKKILEGAEIYITLEPCSHMGQTPPCVDEIIKNKFQKAVISTQDFDERVNGQGIKKLREAGIETVCGVMEKEAREINRGFFKAKKTGLPFITLKLATSLDGKIATHKNESKWISSEKARFFSHHLRSINDAILVGSNTIKRDDPSLDCRIPGLENFSPKRVVVTNLLDFKAESKIFQNTTEIPTIVLINSVKFAEEKREIKQAEEDDALSSDFPAYHPDLMTGSQKNSNSQIIQCAEKNGQVDLNDAMRKLCASGINSVLVEGGQKIATEFLKENLIDEIVWIHNKKIIGDDGYAGIGEMGFGKISEALNIFDRSEIRELDEEIIGIYRKKTS